MVASARPIGGAARQGAGRKAPEAPRALSDERLRSAGARLNRWEVLPSGTLGYNKAEVTAGGVDTRDLSSRTMAATTIPGLYFIERSSTSPAGWVATISNGRGPPGTRRDRLSDRGADANGDRCPSTECKLRSRLPNLR